MELGAMQGRLTEKGGFYPQIFPWLEWEDEFYRAKDMGIAHIEWMLNADRLPDNPILSSKGRARISELEMQTGVQVRSLCMNFVMQYSLRKRETFETIASCLHQLTELQHMRTVVIPLEGASAPEYYPDEALKKDLLKLEPNGQIRCLIESSRSAEEHMNIIGECSETAGICYDVGNAAGLGRDVLKELNMLMEHIGEIHLKDKKNGENLSTGGGRKSTYFGEGVVDFQGLSRWLKQSGYHGNLVLESYFDEALADLRRNLSYLRSL